MYLVMLDTADNSKSSGSAAASGKISADSVTALVARSEDNSVSAAAHTSSSSHSSSAAPPPQLSKVTAFEFMQAWNSLKGITDIEQYVYVLDQIQPADIPKGISYRVDFTLNFSVPVWTHTACIVKRAIFIF